MATHEVTYTGDPQTTNSNFTAVASDTVEITNDTGVEVTASLPSECFESPLTPTIAAQQTLSRTVKSNPSAGTWPYSLKPPESGSIQIGDETPEAVTGEITINS